MKPLSGIGDFFKTSLRLFKKREVIHKDSPQPLPKDDKLATELPKEQKQVSEPSGKSKLPKIVRSELNLEQNSVFTVSTYREKSREITRTFEIDGKTIDRTVIVGKTMNDIEVGILTTTHFKLYLVLLELWERAGRPINDPVHFTTLRVTRRLQLRDGGANYDTVIKAMGSLRETPIRFIDSFQDKNGTFRSISPFTILSHLHFYERVYQTKSGNKRIRGYGDFKFDDTLLKSLLANYSHPIRIDVITSFRKHRDLAVLLYTYIPCFA